MKKRNKGQRSVGKVIEAILAWIFLFVGIDSFEPMYFIASGVFAIASQIYHLRNDKK